MPLLHDELFTCPKCTVVFQTKILGAYDTFGERYSDLYIGSQQNPQPILHKVTICPKCGFSALTEDMRVIDVDEERVETTIKFVEKYTGRTHEDFNSGDGFIFLADAGKYVLPGQILSKIEHRDKAPNNALIAKAVEIIAEKKIPYFVYFHWGEGSFSEFKRRNGFEKESVPRYFIPLTNKGKIILNMKLHDGLNSILPKNVKTYLKDLRKKYYLTKYN